MYAYGYYHIHIYMYMHTNIHFHWKEYDHANERQMVTRSHYALPVSTTLLQYWYYVNAFPTTLVLRQSGYYYVVSRSLPRSIRGYAPMTNILNMTKI